MTPTDAATSPYVVLDPGILDGWTLTRVDGDPADGQVRYVRGDGWLRVTWRRATTYDGYLTSRRRQTPRGTMSLLGRPTEVFAYHHDDHTAVRPVEGETFLEVRATGLGLDDYLDLLGRLRSVDTADFEAVLPPDVARPDQVAAAVASALVGVPVPDGFDPATIELAPYQQPYHLGAGVTGAVACAWLDAHTAARAADADGLRRAEAALRGSREWPVLLAMQAQGDWPAVFWELADQLAAGRPAADLHGQVCDHPR